MTTIIGYIAEPMGILLYWLYNIVGDYGFSLIIFTIIIKTVLFPLTSVQLKQSSKMADIQPKLTQIQKKYATDKETMNQKVMELYKEEGVNPAMGCLPVLVQFPIIIGLFSLLRDPIIYVSNPDMLMVIHESFYWIPDLSQPDKWVLPILAGLTTYFSFKLTSASTPQTGGNPAMKIMQYIFPIMIVWWGRSFPAGLTLYWFVSTFYQIGQQQILIRKNKAEAKKKAELQAIQAEKNEEFEEEEQAPKKAEKKVAKKVVEEEDEEEYNPADYDDFSDFYDDDNEEDEEDDFYEENKESKPVKQETKKSLFRKGK